MCVKVTVPLVRTLVMLILGSAGMTHELFLIPAPNLTRVWVSIGLLLGPAALEAAFRMFRPTPGPPTMVAGSSPSPSSSPPPG